MDRLPYIIGLGCSCVENWKCCLLVFTLQPFVILSYIYSLKWEEIKIREACLSILCNQTLFSFVLKIKAQLAVWLPGETTRRVYKTWPYCEGSLWKRVSCRNTQRGVMDKLADFCGAKGLLCFVWEGLTRNKRERVRFSCLGTAQEWWVTCWGCRSLLFAGAPQQSVPTARSRPDLGRGFRPAARPRQPQAPLPRPLPSACPCQGAPAAPRVPPRLLPQKPTPPQGPGRTALPAVRRPTAAQRPPGPSLVGARDFCSPKGNLAPISRVSGLPLRPPTLARAQGPVTSGVWPEAGVRPDWQVTRKASREAPEPRKREVSPQSRCRRLWPEAGTDPNAFCVPWDHPCRGEGRKDHLRGGCSGEGVGVAREWIQLPAVMEALQLWQLVIARGEHPAKQGHQNAEPKTGGEKLAVSYFI